MQLQKLSDKRIAVMFRIAKTRLYPFFRDPREMIKLRNEHGKRLKNATTS